MKKLFLIISLFIITNNSWGQTFEEAGFSLPDRFCIQKHEKTPFEKELMKKAVKKSNGDLYYTIIKDTLAFNIYVEDISERENEYIKFINNLKQQQQEYKHFFYKGLKTYTYMRPRKETKDFELVYFFCTDQKSYKLTFAYYNLDIVNNFIGFCLHCFTLI